LGIVVVFALALEWERLVHVPAFSRLHLDHALALQW
jgi:hypothetical protein